MKFTPEVRAALLAQGETDASIDAIEADWTYEDICLNVHVCPKCGAAIARKLDEHQVGLKPGEAYAWVNYRCAACAYMIDRAELVPERLS